MGRVLVRALKNVAATERLAEDIAAVLAPGDLVALTGDLGTGKSTLARALLRAVAADPRLEVPSPTFALRIDYTLPRLNVVHADLYRVGKGSELGELGLEEALDHGALLVEWPALLPADIAVSRLDVAMTIEGTGRRAELRASGDFAARLDRTLAVRDFLEGAGRRDAQRWPIAGDASGRAYERIRSGAESTILMNAPARPDGPPVRNGRSYDSLALRALDVRPFVAVATALRAAGIHAPALHAVDMESGLLLLEDLGRETILTPDGTADPERYGAAADLLAFMHARSWETELPLPDGTVWRVPPYDREALLAEVDLFSTWFAGTGGEPAFPEEMKEPFREAWSKMLDRAGPETTLALRDYHSPNILWLPDATGLDRVGVIDFQDAAMGHPAYDLASLGQDARVDVPEELERDLIDRYVAARRRASPRFDAAAFEAAYAIFAAQRATKILGIFTRLALAEGKTGYQRHRNRLKKLLARTLRHQVLSDMRVWYEPFLGTGGGAG